MQWPSKNLDLSRIENIWDVLEMAVYANGKQVYSVTELKKCIIKEWVSLDPQLLHNLNKNMAKRCADVITNQRKGISY